MLSEIEKRSIKLAKSEKELDRTKKKIEDTIKYTFKNDHITVQNILNELNLICEERRKTLQRNPVPHSWQKKRNNQVKYTVHLSNTNNDSYSWLLRHKEFIFIGENSYPGLQIYHPKDSDLFSASDQRLLNFKDGFSDSLNHYAQALKEIIPVGKNLFLTCAPTSQSKNNGSISKLIKSISGNGIIDGSEFLTTIKDRPKKHFKEYKPSDEDLAETISICCFKFSEKTPILILDDITTTGQTFRVCQKIIRNAGYKNSITCLALGRTNRKLKNLGIADNLKHQPSSESLTQINKSLQRRPPKVSVGKFEGIDQETEKENSKYSNQNVNTDLIKDTLKKGIKKSIKLVLDIFK